GGRGYGAAPVEQRFPQAGRAVELRAVGQFARCVDRDAAILSAIFADEIEVLQREPDWVHDRMARCAGRAGAMLLEPLTDRCRGRARSRGEIGFNARGRLRYRCAEYIL